MDEKTFFIYIITNTWNTVLYIGVSSDLIKRIWQHKNKVFKGFSNRYNLCKLVYYEVFTDANYAIMREKQIKAGSRDSKIRLIEKMNPNWDDLYSLICR
jgi:putative endonuclease